MRMRTPQWTGATAPPPNGSAEESVKGTGGFCGCYIPLGLSWHRAGNQLGKLGARDTEVKQR
ncbi:hypothetical protein GCM10010178_54780 [Lentzea flava]|uniref:Uncharacterized protein n=1 Tax=Lentzea flava TaxID=103732 RepID=A0ABQ2UWE8_9PSEU|nr:hypothetical protein GCM10010178_54780 [Lentzea flava]